MSTLLYAALTANREAAPRGMSEEDAPPGVKTYVDALAALVPAEALAIHAFVLGLTTDTDAHGTTVYTDKTALKWSFWGIILLTIVLYVVRHSQGTRTRRWSRPDALRLLIPPAAFVGWAMLQQPSAFDAVWSVNLDRRYIVAAFVAIGLGILAAQLGTVADKEEPVQAPDGQPA